VTSETTWRDRVEAEMAELNTKIADLDRFINQGGFVGKMSEDHVRLLLIQLDTMRSYARVLQARLAL